MNRETCSLTYTYALTLIRRTLSLPSILLLALGSGIFTLIWDLLNTFDVFACDSMLCLNGNIILYSFSLNYHNAFHDHDEQNQIGIM